MKENFNKNFETISFNYFSFSSENKKKFFHVGRHFQIITDLGMCSERKTSAKNGSDFKFTLTLTDILFRLDGISHFLLRNCFFEQKVLRKSTEKC